MIPPSRSTSARSGRHKARRNAMMVLYKIDLLPSEHEAAISEWEREHGFELPPYARHLVEEVLARRTELDGQLQANLADWSLDRLGAVERNILRIAMLELLGEQVPDEVAIDEAVELAKRYASPEAAKLVNGVLGGFLRLRAQSKEQTGE